jgi:hypothetical protein
VLRPGGSMLMLCLASRAAPDFVQPEYRFHLRDAATWDALCRPAGFADVHVETTESIQIAPRGAPIKPFGIILRSGAQVKGG